ncbi:MAG: TetR/AcrR family transcriptional regulator [Myxococcota bacterium]
MPTLIPPPNSREKILEAAETAFATSGYAGTGMRQLASTVGLSKSSLFHHFPTKLELYVEVLDRVIERLEWGLFGAGGAQSGSPAEQLDHWIASIVGTLAESPPSARLLLRALVDEDPLPPVQFKPDQRALMPFEVRLARVVDRFRALLEKGMEQGVFRPVAVGDAIQTTIGAIVLHFASGELGEALIGEPIFSGSAVDRRRREVSEFIRRGLLA